MAAFKLFFFCLPIITASWVKEMENDGLYEGDMVLSPEQLAADKSGKLSYGSIRKRLWPKNIAYDYAPEIASSSKAVAVIQDAIADYHKYTCLRFHKRTNERNYLHFFKGGGCSSPVGMWGKNTISLAGGCWSKPTVIHEMGHSLGFYHEQSRPDRDQYLKIRWENIAKNMQFNFRKQSDIDSQGSPYDYRSVMHYGKKAFGGDKITLDPIDKYYTDLIGNGNGFSKIDIEQFNNLYKCPKYTGPLPEEQTPSCHDKSSYCDKFIREGNCGDRWLSGFCPYSCKKCKVDPNATVPPPTQKPNPSCEDTITNCHEYPKMCNQAGDFRDKWCRKSCNRCNTRPTSCKDNAINCHELLHLCNRSDTIRNVCKKSCGKC